MKPAIAPAAVLACLATSAQAQVGHVTISQIHASSTIYEQDFVELFNSTNAAISLDGTALKVTHGTGQFWDVIPLSGSIPAHGYYLIGMAPSAGATPLPPTQANGNAFISPEGGKVMLSNDTGPLLSRCPSLDSTIDLVLWGEINCEGSPTGPAMAGNDSIFRANGGCTDTDNSATDFASGPAAPRNSSSTHACTTGPDCNGNGIDDTVEVQNPANDCNANGIPDSCDIVTNPSLDCDGNGIIDCTDFKSGQLTDVNLNSTPDKCEGALVFPALETATVIPQGNSADTAHWRVQGTAVENINGQPASAYALARWTNAAISSALDSQFGPGVWQINEVYLTMKFAQDDVSAPGAVTLQHSSNDFVTTTPGVNPPRFNTLAADHPNRQDLAAWITAPVAGASDSMLLFPSLAEPFDGQDDLMLDLQHITGSLTMVLVPTTSTVAFPYAGSTHPTLAGPRLVIFAGPSGPVCGTADFNGDGASGLDDDIEAFFLCLGGDCCAMCWPGGADFNGDGAAGLDDDIESFFLVLGGGNCV